MGRSCQDNNAVTARISKTAVNFDRHRSFLGDGLMIMAACCTSGLSFICKPRLLRVTRLGLAVPNLRNCAHHKLGVGIQVTQARVPTFWHPFGTLLKFVKICKLFRICVNFEKSTYFFCYFWDFCYILIQVILYSKIKVAR